MPLINMGMLQAVPAVEQANTGMTAFMMTAFGLQMNQLLSRITWEVGSSVPMADCFHAKQVGCAMT